MHDLVEIRIVMFVQRNIDMVAVIWKAHVLGKKSVVSTFVVCFRLQEN